MSPNRRPDMDAPGSKASRWYGEEPSPPINGWSSPSLSRAGRGEAVFQIMTHRSDVKTELLSPDGRIYTPNSPEYFAAEEKEILKGAKIHAYRIPQPEAGEWKVRMISPDDGAYLLAVSFIGEGTLDVQMDQSRAKDKGVPLQIRLKNPRLWDVNSFDVRVRVVGRGRKAARRDAGEAAGSSPATRCLGCGGIQRKDPLGHASGDLQCHPRYPRKVP